LDEAKAPREAAFELTVPIFRQARGLIVCGVIFVTYVCERYAAWLWSGNGPVFMEKTVNVLSQALSERLCKLAIDLNNDLGVISGHCN
jgi:hypothetical protein